MSTYFITTEQAETSEIFECMETIPHNCNCGQSYALQADYDADGSIAKDIFIVCTSCTENNLKQSYFSNMTREKMILQILKNELEFLINNPEFLDDVTIWIPYLQTLSDNQIFKLWQNKFLY